LVNNNLFLKFGKVFSFQKNVTAVILLIRLISFLFLNFYKTEIPKMPQLILINLKRNHNTNFVTFNDSKNNDKIEVKKIINDLK